MGSFIQFLKTELQVKDKEFKKQMLEKESLISDLEAKIEKLNLEGEELRDVKEDLKKLKEQKLREPSLRVVFSTFKNNTNCSKLLVFFLL